MTSDPSRLAHWRVFWLVDEGAWQLLYFFLLACIMLLWRPSKNSRRYAYAELSQQEEEAIELPVSSLTHHGVFTNRGSGGGGGGGGGVAVVMSSPDGMVAPASAAAIAREMECERLREQERQKAKELKKKSLPP